MTASAAPVTRGRIEEDCFESLDLHESVDCLAHTFIVLYDQDWRSGFTWTRRFRTDHDIVRQGTAFADAESVMLIPIVEVGHPGDHVRLRT